MSDPTSTEPHTRGTTGHAEPTAVVPMLFFDDVVAAQRWLAAAFGLETTAEHPDAGGDVVGVEMRLGTGRVMLLGSAEDAALGMSSPRRTGAATGGVYVSVDDVTAHHRRAAAAGATIVLPLREMDYGSVEYGALDLEGHYWGFGTYRLR